MSDQHVLCGGLRTDRGKPDPLYIDLNAAPGSPTLSILTHNGILAE
jgi:hypothetical protein